MNDPMICCLSCIMVQRPSALMTRTPSLPRAAAVGTTPVTLRCVSESRTTWDNATGSLNWMPISWETFTSRRTNFAGHLEKVDLEMAEFSLFSHTSYYNIYIYVCMYPLLRYDRLSFLWFLSLSSYVLFMFYAARLGFIQMRGSLCF